MPAERTGLGTPQASVDGVLTAEDVAACVIEAVHTWMTIRGVKKHGSTMVTSELRGIFKENPASRAEILSLMYGTYGQRS